MHAKPFSWPPSGYWDGVDGNWSTFSLRIEEPEQVVRILPSTAGDATLVVSPNGCSAGEPGEALTCARSRGGMFNASKSTHWNDTGVYTMELENDSGLNDTADYGLDTVALGLSNHTGGPQLDAQVVGAFANNGYYFGMFGLGQQPINFSSSDTPYPSFLTTLKTRNMIPSLSWAYTAGAHYQSEGFFGSLTLGGYDLSRLVPNDVPFTLDEDSFSKLVVGIQSVTATYTNGSATALLQSPLLGSIDSTITEISLPVDVCKLFEAEFGLIWNGTYEKYFVEDDHHENLVAANPSITLRVGDSLTGGATVEIILPYAAFDTILEYPLVASSRRYFPIVRDSSSLQSTLGRIFLQEAYIITNYEESNFSVYQTRFDNGAKPNLITIPAAGSTTGNRHVSRAIELGASIGATVLALLSLLIVTLAWKKWGCCRGIRHQGQSRDRTKATDLAEELEDSKAVSIREIGPNSMIGTYRELADSGKAELQDETTHSSCGQNVSDLSQDHPGTPHGAPESSSPSLRGPRMLELMTRRSSYRATTVQESSAEDRLAIFGLTNISRASRATIDVLKSTDMPCVEKLIHSPNPMRLDLDRSLPPTPISESPQVSPIVASQKSIATMKDFEMVVGKANFRRYAVGSTCQIPSRTQSSEVLVDGKRSQRRNTFMELEIVVPRSFQRQRSNL